MRQAAQAAQQLGKETLHAVRSVQGHAAQKE